MRTLWTKLPDPLQTKWRSFGVKSKINSGGRNPTLSVFITFLQEIHTELNDDFFGDFIAEPRFKRNATVLRSGADTIEEPPVVTHTSEITKQASKSSCALHQKSNHLLEDCWKFQKMNFQESRSLVWNEKLCFRCFGQHLSKKCTSDIKCDKCQMRHHVLMHDDAYEPQFHRQKDRPNYKETKNLCVDLCSSTEEKLCSKTMLIHIRHKRSDTTLKAYDIVDEQSNNTFIDPTVLSELGLDGHRHDYCLRTLSGLQNNVSGFIVNGLQVRGTKKTEWFNLPTAITKPYIPDSRAEVATPSVIGRHNHLRHLKKHFIDLDKDVPVLMLIGADAGEILYTRCHGTQAPYAHETPIGWALVGSAWLNDPSRSKNSKSLRTSAQPNEFSYSANSVFPLCNEQKLNIFKEWEDDESIDVSVQDKEFLSLMTNEVSLNEGKLTMPLPFKEMSPKMPDNKNAVLHRTKVALERIKKDQYKLDQCVKSMATNLKKGHIERVPSEEINPKLDGQTWFLPLFSVTHRKKKKERLVFDASASFQGVSLNCTLMKGPYLTNNLRSVLLRFRNRRIGVTCDIEHMFYNFYLPEHQKDYLRFFWYKDNDPEKGLVQYRANVHIFGASSSPAVASFGLRYAAENTTMPEVEKAKQFIFRSFYVDDGVTSVECVDEGIELLTSVKELLHGFGINIHKFSSSDKAVLKAFDKEDIADNIDHIDFDESPSQRTLVIVWELKADSFVAKADILDTPFTKRGVLAAVNSYFDPIGIASPVILGGRLIQRMVIPSKDKNTDQLEACGWDDPLPVMYLPAWNAWKKSLVNAHLLKIPRCFVPKDFGTVLRRELHVYCDASIQAIGVAIYLRSFNEKKERNISLVTAVSRVAPRAATTVPRLELTAALQASVTSQEVLKEIDVKIDEVSHYSDSQVVLGYLNNTTRYFTRYVTRRVESIIKVTSPDQWSYVSTMNNPADLASRPMDPLSLLDSCWFTGPDELKNDTIQKQYLDLSEVELPETMKQTTTLITNMNDFVDGPLKNLATRRSNWKFLLRVAKIVLTFAHKLLAIKNRSNFRVTIKYTKESLLLFAQKEIYADLISLLTRNPNLPDNHPLSNLNPFLDCRGILRVGGRLSYAVPFDVAHPILVPDNHIFSTRLLQHLHEEVGHQGRHITHGHVRSQGYHFENGRKVIGELLKKCVLCRRLRGNFSSQMMSNLPPDRLETSPPFTNTGMDVFGPLYVHDGVNTRRTSATKKLFVLILTCLVTRAVHLEPLVSMDTSALINALRRFFAIRGYCKRLCSDHGSNFIGALNQASPTIDTEKLKEIAETNECEWLLNPPGASHFGGVWERKIASVRRVLEGTMKISGNNVFSRDEMVTLLQESAAIVNSTPLYGVSSDPNDAAPITPNSLLTLKDNPNPSSLELFTERDLLQYGSKRWRRIQYLADQFWVRWKNSYIQELRVRRKWKTPKRNLRTGDIVLLRVKTSPRNAWPLAIVESTKVNDDGLVRSVYVRIGTKSYERKVHDLVLLIEKTEN